MSAPETGWLVPRPEARSSRVDCTLVSRKVWVVEEDDRESGEECVDLTGNIAGTLGVIGLQGHIDAIESGRVYGWAWDPERPKERVVVDIYFKENLIQSVVADRFRQDLVDVRVGDGSHAFVFDLPSDARQADSAAIAVYFSETQVPLSRGGRSMLPVLESDVDPTTLLSDRLDRVEASIQQMFRAMHIIRRGEGEGGRVAEGEFIDALSKAMTDMTKRHETLVGYVDSLETAINASRSFIDRFEIEIHDRVSRGEVDEIAREIRAIRRRNRVMFLFLGLCMAGLAVMFYAGLR